MQGQLQDTLSSASFSAACQTSIEAVMLRIVLVGLLTFRHRSSGQVLDLVGWRQRPA